jgi:Putative prokaryotic signal transducing protein
VCPSCAAAHEASARFCRECGLPLVLAPGVGDSGPPLTEARERARKIRPQYSEGPLVRVAFARNQAEAELIQGLLLEEGVPSVVKRSRGFDVPDFLAAGPRDIFVPASGVDVARDVLPAAPPARRPPARAWVQAMAVALAVLLVAVSAAGVLVAVFG